MTGRKKLIEVALPLDAINAAAAREKSIRHGHRVKAKWRRYISGSPGGGEGGGVPAAMAAAAEPERRLRGAGTAGRA